MIFSFIKKNNFFLIMLCLTVFSLSGCKKNKKNQYGFGSGSQFSHSGYSGSNEDSSSPGSSKDFSINVGDRIFFDTDSSSIRPDASETLIRQAQWLMRYKSYMVRIEGHADERGTREYNLGLGARRSAAVRDFLISQGISENRLQTISYGKELPVAVCDDISCWSQNRRAVTVIGLSR